MMISDSRGSGALSHSQTTSDKAGLGFVPKYHRLLKNHPTKRKDPMSENVAMRFSHQVSEKLD